MHAYEEEEDEDEEEEEEKEEADLNIGPQRVGGPRRMTARRPRHWHHRPFGPQPLSSPLAVASALALALRLRLAHYGWQRPATAACAPKNPHVNPERKP